MSSGWLIDDFTGVSPTTGRLQLVQGQDYTVTGALEIDSPMGARSVVGRRVLTFSGSSMKSENVGASVTLHTNRLTVAADAGVENRLALEYDLTGLARETIDFSRFFGIRVYGMTHSHDVDVVIQIVRRGGPSVQLNRDAILRAPTTDFIDFEFGATKFAGSLAEVHMVRAVIGPDSREEATAYTLHSIELYPHP
ncbi:MAG: hypothetical protein KF726_22965 [Anaerolineae bacterium]|nr:hypothetical protein [Anaerolineae bacterium]